MRGMRCGEEGRNQRGHHARAQRERHLELGWHSVAKHSKQDFDSMGKKKVADRPPRQSMHPFPSSRMHPIQPHATSPLTAQWRSPDTRKTGCSESEFGTTAQEIKLRPVAKCAIRIGLVGLIGLLFQLLRCIVVYDIIHLEHIERQRIILTLV